MSSNKVICKLVLVLLAGVATKVVAAPAETTNLDTLQRMLEAQGQVQLQMQRRLEQMSYDVDELRGTIERNSYDISQMLERQRELYREVDNLSRQTVKEVSEPTDNAAVTTESYTGNVGENDAYEQAVDLILKQKDYKGAIKAFQSFLVTYPDSVYKPNASYWLGQLYFAQNNLAEAAANFNVVAQTESSNKRADSLLKLGVIAERSNDIAKAKQYYNMVISAYPDSTTAKQATASLTKLSNK